MVMHFDMFGANVIDMVFRNLHTTLVVDIQWNSCLKYTKLVQPSHLFAASNIL
jgi:hypothetical protein